MKLALTISVLSLGLLLAVAASAGARVQAKQIRVSAALNAKQATPSPGGDVSAARGTFTATLTRAGTGATLAWKLVFSGLTGPAAAAHVHIGLPGQAGPVVVPLCGPCQSGMTGTANASADALEAILEGRAYVNVHTAQNPAGEIRGRPSIVTSVRTRLVPGQERPRPSGNLRRARGLFTGTITKTGETATLRWRLTFRGLTGRAVAAHIHIGARGRSGSVALPLCGPCRSGVHRRAKLDDRLLRALENGRAYVNVHTARNPAGEIRGQIPAAALSLR